VQCWRNDLRHKFILLSIRSILEPLLSWTVWSIVFKASYIPRSPIINEAHIPCFVTIYIVYTSCKLLMLIHNNEITNRLRYNSPPQVCGRVLFADCWVNISVDWSTKYSKQCYHCAVSLQCHLGNVNTSNMKYNAV